MNVILNYLYQAYSFLIPMIVLLGVLIFIHELGHFLVAKYFNVKVETFSLGFGPKIWKYTRGETTYCISAIPFGGYVKMFGDEMGGNVDPDLQHRSFLHKPIYQRIAIALAGPLMNLGLAFLLFLAIAFVGEQVVAPQLGDIDEGTPAYTQGFRSGDKITAINDTPVQRWESVEQIVSQSLNKELNFSISRDGAATKVTATPTGTEGKMFQMGQIVGHIEGFDFMANSSLVAVSDPKSVFGKLGFQTGDQVLSVNGTEVKTLRNLYQVLATQNKAEQILFKVDRHNLQSEEPPKSLEIAWNLKQIPFPASADLLGIQKPETFVGLVQKDSPAEKAGLKTNDQIIKINGKAIKSFKDIIGSVSAYTEATGPLQIEALREGKITKFSMTPKMTELKNEIGAADKRFTIGIVPLKSNYVEYIKWQADGTGASLDYAGKKTWQWTHATVMSFVLLIQNKVSPKNLGGFISIGQMAQKSWEIGLDAFLRIMAIISLNLFILNLLPIPVLDGGHILLFSIEAIKGTPLSLKKIAIAQQIGVFFLLFLMAFSLFNDFSRLFGFS